MQDWTALDADVDCFIAQFSKAPSTRRNHQAGWKEWVAHCGALGVDPMNAPYRAFEDLLLRRREDGLEYARGSHDIVLAAVGAEYALAGRTPAHQEPGNVGDWRTLMKAASREAKSRQRKHPGSAEQWAVTPLMRNDLVAMLSGTPYTTPRLDACAATVLLAIDGQFSARELGRLGLDAVTALEDGGVRIAGREFACDHTERVRGVPWDCTACAVRAVRANHSGEGPLLAAATEGAPVPAATRRLVALRDRSWGGVDLDRDSSGWRSTRLTPAADLTAWQLAGFRRACVLSTGRRGEAGTWLRARAWTALAWTCGFRMCGDLLRLDRDAVAVDPDGRGYRVDLAGTKDDPHGDKHVVRPLPWGTGGAPSVAGMVAEYVCVRDAVHGRGGSLIVRDLLTGRGAPGQGLADGGRGIGGGANVAKGDLGLLCDLANLEGRGYSSYSTRKGFAEQAIADGWPVEDIRDALRHRTLGVTLNSYLKAAMAKEVTTKLIGRVGGSTP